MYSSGGPLHSVTQSREPRDQKQIYNRKYTLKNNTDVLSNNEEMADELMDVLNEQRNNSYIKTVNINPNNYSFFLCSEEQIEDVEKFCCSERRDNIVLSVDTTFNLCNLWTTDTSYRNRRLINPRTNDHPVFLGPVLLHFSKDANIFNRLALEMLSFNSNIINLKRVRVDMEGAIFNGIKNLIKNLERLLCAEHLSDRDKEKIINLLAKTSQTGNEKRKSTKEIIADIYGKKYGAVLEYGLGDSSDSTDFEAKLNSLKDKWSSLCPGFFGWFLKRRKDLFINGVIESARKSTGVAGLYYQSDIESLHFIEKMNLCYKTVGVIELIRSLKKIVERQKDEETQALYGGGPYVLADSSKRYLVDAAKWHTR